MIIIKKFKKLFELLAEYQCYNIEVMKPKDSGNYYDECRYFWQEIWFSYNQLRFLVKLEERFTKDGKFESRWLILMGFFYSQMMSTMSFRSIESLIKNLIERFNKSNVFINVNDKFKVWL